LYIRGAQLRGPDGCGGNLVENWLFEQFVRVFYLLDFIIHFLIKSHFLAFERVESLPG
jgi:hypothetical protein